MQNNTKYSSDNGVELQMQCKDKLNVTEQPDNPLATEEVKCVGTEIKYH